MALMAASNVAAAPPCGCATDAERAPLVVVAASGQRRRFARRLLQRRLGDIGQLGAGVLELRKLRGDPGVGAVQCRAGRIQFLLGRGKTVF